MPCKNPVFITLLEFCSGLLNYSKGEYDFSILNDLDDENVIKYFRTIRNGIMKAKGFKTLSKKDLIC